MAPINELGEVENPQGRTPQPNYTAEIATLRAELQDLRRRVEALEARYPLPPITYGVST